MNKANVFSLRERVKTPQRATFTDSTGQSYVFTLRPLSELEMAACDEFADRLSRRFITGGYVDSAGDFREKPEILHLLEDENGSPHPIELSSDVMAVLARLERMQGIRRDVFDDAPPENGYGVKELAILAACEPELWIELQLFRRKVQAGYQKKAPAGSVGISSAPDSAPEADTQPSGPPSSSS